MDANMKQTPRTPRAANLKSTSTKPPTDVVMRDSIDSESEDELGSTDFASPTPRGARHRAAEPQLDQNLHLPNRNLILTGPPGFPSAYAASLTQRSTEESSRSAIDPPPRFSLPSKSASEASSRRSRSPTKGIKGMADLLFAEKRVQIVPRIPQQDVPEDVRGLCERLVDISDGCQVVPESIIDEVRKRIDQVNPLHKLRPYHINTDGANTQTRDSLLGELWTLSKVARETMAANVYTYSEAHWNARIHAPMLEAGIEIDAMQNGTIGEDVRYLDATKASISNVYVPRHTDGDSLAGKMIDYCIVLNSPDVQEAARAALLAQEPPTSSAASSASSVTSRGSRRSAKSTTAVAEATQSINHTEYPPLRLSPIAVSIETKQPEGSDDQAKAQLSVWVASHFLRLHKLARSPLPIGLTLPLLHVSGRVWHVYLAIERPDRIDLFEWVTVEGTETLIGCYKVLSLLRALRAWAVDCFQPKFLDLLRSVTLA
ncbi:uncharacterized protein CTRU02_215697 [Colletotrichum truncatum]|uniref:Uncharacterized protein n=1 Tax=Colletotrichum truncatum TaxID=5467 RepID=A0ACC3YBY9_COLTU